METPQSPSPQEASAPGGLLELAFLQARVNSPAEQVKMWAAFHLVDRWQERCEEFLDVLWNQDQEEIRESAINLAGKFQIKTYAFPLLRLFRSGDAALGPMAGVALGRMRYEPAHKLLHLWFQRLSEKPDVTPTLLESAAASLLSYDNRIYWDEVYAEIGRFSQNHGLFTVLFNLLANHAETPRQMERLVQVYGQARDVFHDVQITLRLLEAVGLTHLSRYVQGRLSGGYPLNTVYQESLRTLGVEIPEGNAKALIEDLAECRNSRTGVERFLVVADGLLDCFFPGGEGVERERGLLQGFRHWSGDWEEGILKLRDTEYHLLVCLPLGAMLRRVESACLALPEREALRISHIYRSPLLSPRFMSQVLHLVASGKAPGDASAMDSQGMNGWVRDEEKDCLWKLYTGQLDDVDYPFERVLPQPWMYPLPDLMRRLHAVLRRRFTSYLASNRSQAVDYALEVFRRVGDESLVPALLEHFESLITRHYHSFIELMTHLPHQDFLPPLLSYYREGETDLRQLIRFICDVHSRVYPAAVKVATEDETPVPALSTLRLRCPACGGAYQYRPKQLFVNEDRIEQRQIPTPNDLWSPEPLHCKQCQALVPLAPDERYLADLFSELLARRMMRSEPPAAMNPDLLMLVSFPKVHGVSRHPEVFMESLKAAQGKGAEHIRLMLELGRFRMDTGQREEARGLFTRLLSGPVPCPQALFYLGLIAFQERNLYQARIYFSRLVQTSTPEDFQDELDNPVDMAHHYLKLLDKREFKRSQFQIVDN